MSSPTPPVDDPGGDDRPQVTVRYWASIRAAAGIDSEHVAAKTLADILAEISTRHPDQRFRDQLRICSVLVGSQPVGARDPATVEVTPGIVVEFLPPFAGG